MKKSIIILVLSIILLFFIVPVRAQIIPFTIPGATQTWITCTNDSNFLAGYFENASGIHGFINNGATTKIINYPGAVQTYIYGINNHYKVVGAYNTNGSLTSNEGFAYDTLTGNFTNLTTSWIPSMDNTIARDINDGNCVVGDYKQNTTHVCFLMCNGNSTFHYNYQPTYINSVNNTGKRAGFWIDGSQRHGLIYNYGTWQQIDYPGSTRTMFTSVNDSGVAVGVFNLTRSFIYRNGAFKELKKTGAIDFQIRDINNKGMAVGYYKDAAGVYIGFHVNIWDINFRPNPNGWQFANGGDNIWPESWYRQFNYTHDPYLGGDSWFPPFHYKSGLVDTLARVAFPDWPLFVEVLGEDQCYMGTGDFRVLRAKAVQRYYGIVNDWGGSCFGFVQSSFMVWDSIQRFKTKFPKVGPWQAGNKLYDLPLNDENRKCINHLMVKQSQEHYYAYKATQANVGPNETLENVKKMLLDKSKNECGLIIRNTHPEGGGHIVNPYKVMVDTLNPFIEYIYVYDNNCPNDTTRKITIYKVLNCWFYNLSANATDPPEEWGGFNADHGLYLSWPVRTWYNQTILDSVVKSPLLDNIPGNSLEVYTNPDCDIIITNDAGQQTGYQGQAIVANIPGATPMVSESGSKQPPYGYYLPDSHYLISLNNFKNTGSTLSLITDKNTFSFSRKNVSLTQNDRFEILDGAFSFNNPDNQVKNIDLGGIFENLGNEMEVNTEGLGIHGGQQIKLEILNNTNEVKVFNSGPSTQYHLSMRYANANGEAKFLHDSVPMDANTAHIISPDWSSLQTANVTIYVDHGNNNTIEDTLFFGNVEPPQIMAYPPHFSAGTTGATDTLHITNSGGGILHWVCRSSDTSWLKVVGDTAGVNTGMIIFSIASSTGSSRSGHLTLIGTGATNTPYTIEVRQEGIINPPSTTDATKGTLTGKVQVSWSSVSGAQRYQVYRSEFAGNPGVPVSPWITATIFNDSLIVKGLHYYYSIKASPDTLGNITSAFSNAALGYSSCFVADFSITGLCAGQTTALKSKTTAHSRVYYNWDINQDSIPDYTGQNLNYTFFVPNTYLVTLTVTDSSLCSYTLTKQLDIQAFPTLNLPSDSTLCANQSITLNAGAGFQTYLWSNGATTPVVTIDSVGYGLGLAPVYVSVTSTNGCRALATVRLVFDTCSAPGGSNLEGIVSYDNNASTPLNNVTLKLWKEGNLITQTVTDGQGHYSLGNLAPGTYSFTFNCTKAWGSVNSIDALKVLKHFTGMALLQGIRLKAADVNGDHAVNSIDALQLSKRFVAIINSFNVGDWIFESPEIQITGPGNQVQNIKGLVYGDVDGSYVPPSKEESSVSLENQGFGMIDNSNKVIIPIQISQPTDVGAISLILGLPDQIAQISKVSTDFPGELLYHQTGNELRISWYSLTPMILNAGENFLTLTGILKEKSQVLDSWTVLAPSQFGDCNAAPITHVNIIVPDLLVNAESCYLGQNTPNPAKQSTRIPYYLSDPGRTVLKIYNNLGQEVLTLVDQYQGAGIHQAYYNVENLAPGMYQYKVEITTEKGFYTDSKQLLIAR